MAITNDSSTKITTTLTAKKIYWLALVRGKENNLRRNFNFSSTYMEPRKTQFIEMSSQQLYL